MADPHVIVAIAGAIGAGLVAGIFVAFSNFVMPALGRLPPAEGMRAMQAINITVLNPLFLGGFLGSGVVALGGIALALIAWRDAASVLLITGGVLQIGGVLLVTGAGNVPLNEALARRDAGEPPAEAEGAWRDYQRRWTRWNHLRSVAGVVALLAYCLALSAMPA